MKGRAHPYAVFIALGLGAYVVAETAAEFAARLIVAGGAPIDALAQGFFAAFPGISGTAVFAAPFVLLGWICGSLAKKSGFKKAGVLFFIGVCALGAVSFIGADAAQEALKKHAWTAAALAYLCLPIYSVPVLAAALVIRFLAWRKNVPSPDKV